MDIRNIILNPKLDVKAQNTVNITRERQKINRISEAGEDEKYNDIISNDFDDKYHFIWDDTCHEDRLT